LSSTRIGLTGNLSIFILRIGYRMTSAITCGSWSSVTFSTSPAGFKNCSGPDRSSKPAKCGLFFGYRLKSATGPRGAGGRLSQTYRVPWSASRRPRSLAPDPRVLVFLKRGSHSGPLFNFQGPSSIGPGPRSVARDPRSPARVPRPIEANRRQRSDRSGPRSVAHGARVADVYMCRFHANNSQ